MALPQGVNRFSQARREFLLIAWLSTLMNYVCSEGETVFCIHNVRRSDSGVIAGPFCPSEGAILGRRAKMSGNFREIVFLTKYRQALDSRLGTVGDCNKFIVDFGWLLDAWRQC